MIKVYSYSRCIACRKALKWLDDHGITYELADIRTDHPNEALLRKLHAMSGLPLQNFWNTGGKPFRDLDLVNRLPAMSEDEQFALLASDGLLVKRPLLVTDSLVLPGFRSGEWEEKLL